MTGAVLFMLAVAAGFEWQVSRYRRVPAVERMKAAAVWVGGVIWMVWMLGHA